MILVGEKPIEFNVNCDRVYVNMDWDSDINVDDYLVLEVYQVIDPSTYTNVYNDLWLKRYTTALMKKQWGQNLKKFDSITLPGGITYNGQSLYDEAVSEIENFFTSVVNILSNLFNSFCSITTCNQVSVILTAEYKKLRGESYVH